MSVPENPKRAPRETFLEILRWMPIPTFDLIIEYGDQGIILVKRSIAPYKDVWALPGLRKYKGDSLGETLERVAKDELGLVIAPGNRLFVGQFVGQFEEENKREDISTCYAVNVDSNQAVTPNKDHFSEMRILTSNNSIPQPIGEMYRYYLEQYRETSRKLK